MAGLGFDDKMPRLVSAKTHAVIDYLHVATNFVAAAMFFRKNKPAGIGAAILGASVLANALMTDYELGVFRLYSFKVHGMLDYGVAATSALIPTLFGITDTPEAKFFHIQGGAETLAAGVSNYDDDSGAERTGHSERNWESRQVA